MYNFSRYLSITVNFSFVKIIFPLAIMSEYVYMFINIKTRRIISGQWREKFSGRVPLALDLDQVADFQVTVKTIDLIM